MHASAALGLAVGVLQLVLAALILRHLGRFGRRLPWLGALFAYFCLRGVVRIYVGASGDDRPTLNLVSDVLLLVVLVLLALGLRQTVAALSAAADEARLRAQEYERALRDYRLLVRHRLANPLMSIRGSVQTLRARQGALSPQAHEELLALLESQTLRLQQLSLRPDELTEEERDLSPTDPAAAFRARGSAARRSGGRGASAPGRRP